MKTKKCNKIVSLFLMLAMSVTAFGAATLTACGKSNNTSKDTVISEVKGNTYYVDVDGTAFAKGTEDDPFYITTLLNFSVANSEHSILQPGDTVIVNPGVYDLSNTIYIGYSGNYKNYITIKSADPNQETVLSFYDMAFDSTKRGVEIDGSYIVWDGIDIRGAGDNGMYIGGSYNIVQNSNFYNNRDTGLQLGRSFSDYNDISKWPSYNLIKNCSSFNNYDNETYGENADGFAAKLTVGYCNIFDGCIAYRNSDDGWDLYAKTDSGNIGAVIMYNCVAFENGFLMETQATCNERFTNFRTAYAEDNTNSYTTRDGDGNGFKLGGSIMEGEVFMYNCLSFNNRMHGVTDNSNPGVISIDNVTSYNNSASVDDDSSSDTFGQIIYKAASASSDSCNNIDLSRQSYSYNHLSNVLSVNNDDVALGADKYRGTVDNSLLLSSSTGDKWNIIDTIAEFDTYEGIFKTQSTADASDASDIFDALPSASLGLNNYNIDSTYRNSDNSINMGNILNVTNNAITIGNGTNSSTYTCGSSLNKTSWDSYTHYDYTNLTTCKSVQDATATAVIKSLYLPVNLSACYQDFDIVTKMQGVKVTWKSSNSDILNITDETGTSNSKHEDVKVEVLRPEGTDEVVTLTATVKVGSVTKTRDFVVTVKENTYRIGDISVEGVENNEIIIDQGDNYNLKSVTVKNATSDSGKLIDQSKYTVTTKIEYAENGDASYSVAPFFDTSLAGIYKITETVTLKSDVNILTGANQSESYEYKVYVASKNADVDFKTGTSSVSVYKDGFIISGTPTNVTGKISVLTQTAGSTAPDAQTVIGNGETREFRASSINMSFDADNSQAYDIYYVFTNINGRITSSVQKISVTTSDISTVAEFEAMLKNNNSNTIYRLVNDIDFENATVNTSETSFVGLFNGCGYSIKNFKIESDTTYKTIGLFRTVKGGTIMNVKFDNVSIVNEQSRIEKTGIIGQMYGGYIYNVSVTNINITSNSNRTGVIVGQIISDTNDGTTVTYIERVSVVNDSEHTITASQRTGGIVGFIQASSADNCNIVYIKDCYVNVVITSQDYSSGIVARSDDRNAKDYLQIENCVFVGSITGNKYVGGMLGGWTGAGKTRISNCVNIGKLYYAGESDEVTTAQKNCSGIAGYYSANSDTIVSNCFAKFEEHNSNYNVTVIVSSQYSLETYWKQYIALDYDLWTLNKDESGNLTAPYITLNLVFD
jgi:hypothetical protein